MIGLWKRSRRSSDAELAERRKVILREANAAANRMLAELARTWCQLDNVPVILELGWLRSEYGSYRLVDPESGFTEYPLDQISAARAAGCRIAMRVYRQEWERRLKEERRRLQRVQNRLYAEISGRHPRYPMGDTRRSGIEFGEDAKPGGAS